MRSIVVVYSAGEISESRAETVCDASCVFSVCSQSFDDGNRDLILSSRRAASFQVFDAGSQREENLRLHFILHLAMGHCDLRAARLQED